MRHVLKTLNWIALLLLLFAGAAPAHADPTDGHGEYTWAVDSQQDLRAHIEAPGASTEPAIHCGMPILDLHGPVPLPCRLFGALTYHPGHDQGALAQPPAFDPPPPRSPMTTI